jgi:hypothetical protein
MKRISGIVFIIQMSVSSSSVLHKKKLNRFQAWQYTEIKFCQWVSVTKNFSSLPDRWTETSTESDISPDTLKF